tara:strand:- start:67 stop:519 length:453 start_codon:yes stop_codon:yes gene_type:complete
MDYHGYTVYKNGDILRKNGKGMLKPSKNRDGGYLVVCIYINKKKSMMLVHRLVALCYIPNPDNKPEVDHILSKEKTNNNLSNLRWATRTEQMTNRGIGSDNTSGVKGVRKNKNGWTAFLTINGKTMTKAFPTFEKAVAKRQEWELEHHCL